YRAVNPRQLRSIARREARASHVPVAVVRPRACTAVACHVTYGHGGSDPVGDFLSNVANKVVNYLIDHNAANSNDVIGYVRSIIHGVKGAAGQRALGCGSAAASGWQESAAIRGSYPVGGLGASATYTATRCLIGALGG